MAKAEVSVNHASMQFAHGRWQGQRGAYCNIGPPGPAAPTNALMGIAHGHAGVSTGRYGQANYQVQVQIAVRPERTCTKGREGTVPALPGRCHRGVTHAALGTPRPALGRLRCHTPAGNAGLPKCQGRAALQPPGALRVAPQQQPPTLGTALQAA